MKVMILCGGQGTRLREETEFRPKPLVEIADRPVLWHIMRIYATHGYKDFVLCLGYKGWLIKEYFLNYKAYSNDFTIQLGSERAVEFHTSNGAYKDLEDWRVTFAETGLNSMTGYRVRMAAHYVQDNEFMLTYGDGLADINLRELLQFHRSHGRIGTVTAVASPGRFGELGLTDDFAVHRFTEKPSGGTSVNGGFFVFNRDFLEYLPDDPNCVLEKRPLEKLAADGQLMAYRHPGFWQTMDTYREFLYLNDLWDRGAAPWKIWK